MKSYMICVLMVAVCSVILASTYENYFELTEEMLPEPVQQSNLDERFGDDDVPLIENGGAIGIDSYYVPELGLAYVYGGAYISVVDLTSMSLVTSIPIPDWIPIRTVNSNITSFEQIPAINIFAYDSLSEILFCAAENGRIHAIDVNSNSILYTIPDQLDNNSVVNNMLLFDPFTCHLYHYCSLSNFFCWT